MNDDAHKFTSDASETNSLENAKKLKEWQIYAPNIVYIIIKKRLKPADINNSQLWWLTHSNCRYNN